MGEKIENNIDKEMTRRDFVKTAAGVAAGAALGPVAQSAWAAPLVGKKIKLKLRQDLIYDGLFDLMLQTLNKRSKKIKVKSSYVNSNLGWGYERDHADETPLWYEEGEQADLFLGRGPALAQLADDGVIAPLDKFLEASGKLSREDFHHSRYGTVLDSATYRDSLWGIPIIGDTYALFCNKDLFAAAGVEKPPVNWEETIEKAHLMTRDTNGDGKPDVFGYSQCSFQYPLQIVTSGIDYVDLANKRVLFDSDEGVEALDTYRRVRSYSPPHVNFENGDMGMKISVTTNSHGKYRHLNYFTSRLPEGRRRANTYGDSDGISAFAISAKIPEERQLAAWKAIEMLMSERLYFKMVESVRMLPLRNSIRTGERYAEYLKKNPQIQAFVDEMEWAVPKPCIPEYRFMEVVMREILYPVQKEGAADLTLGDLREHLKVQAARANERLQKSSW